MQSIFTLRHHYPYGSTSETGCRGEREKGMSRKEKRGMTRKGRRY